MKRLALLCSALLATAPLRAAAVDPYEDLAGRLSHAAERKLTDKKIAVLTFEYVDRRDSPGGRAVSEKLTNRFVELGVLTVIERGMVEKVMKELEFQNTGTVDPDGARKLGKGLGVEAIVTGTIEDASSGMVEINARVIKTESYEIIAAATQKVKKTWSDQPAPAASAPAYETPSVSMQRRSSSSGPGSRHGYIDFVFGPSAGVMDVELSSTRNVPMSELGISGLGALSVRSASFTGMTLTSGMNLGVRMGAFGRNFGGDFEFGTFTHGTAAQRTNTTLGAFSYPINYVQDYLRVQTNYLAGDVHIGAALGPRENVIPYVGLGMGMSINTMTSNYVRMNNGGVVNALLNETNVGFMFRIPFGIRFYPTDNFSLFMEGRPWFNNFAFDREIAQESDTASMRGFQFLFGLGLGF